MSPYSDDGPVPAVACVAVLEAEVPGVHVAGEAGHLQPIRGDHPVT